MSWQGSVTDHNCTVDEAKAYDRTSFSYTCSAVNCQMKYGTDTSDDQFGFDSVCRICTQCTGTDGENCDAQTVVVDDGCDSVNSCGSTVDCGPHGTNLGLYACTCDDGYKTDVTSDSYCTSTDVTGQQASVNSTSTDLDETGTDIVIAVSVIAASVVLIAICVGGLSVNIRNKKKRFYPSGRPMNKDAAIISFNMISILIDGEQSDVIMGLLDGIHWPPKALAKRPTARK